VAFFMNKIFLTEHKLLHHSLRWLQENRNHFPAITDDVIIAINEVLQNIYRHAYQLADGMQIDVSITQTEHCLRFDITDYAKPMDLSFLDHEHEPSEEGGMGLRLIKKVAQSFTIEYTGHGHLTQLEFCI